MQTLLYCLFGMFIAIIVVTIIWIKPIRISYSVNRHALTMVNACTFLFSVMCILYYIQFDIASTQNCNNILFIFIKQGGGVLLITIISGFLNRMLIQAQDLDRFYSYSTENSKINYSIICIASAVICFIDLCSNPKRSIDNPLLAQGIMWINNFGGTMVSFDGLSKPRVSKKEKKNIDKIALIKYIVSLSV